MVKSGKTIQRQGGLYEQKRQIVKRNHCPHGNTLSQGYAGLPIKPVSRNSAKPISNGGRKIGNTDG